MFFWVVLLLPCCLCYKILVLSPSLSHSHIHFQGAIADVLVDGGHEVHIFIPEYDAKEKSNGSVKAHKVTRYTSNFDTLFKNISFKKNVFASEGLGFAFDLQGWDYFRNTTVQYCQDMANDGALIEELRNEKYDVAIAEGYNYCYFGLFHALNIPGKIVTFAISLTENLADAWGLPSPKSYVVNSLNGIPDSPQLTLYERFINLLAYFSCRFYGFEPSERLENQILQKRFGREFPSLREIMKNVSLAFVNSIDFLEISRPISKKIVYIGGLNVAHPKSQLQPELQKVFESAKAGVILFSFGGIVDSSYMTRKMKTSFLKAFSRLPEYKFIWKSNFLDAEAVMKEYPNVHLVEWMDQTTILAHPKTRAFITHCGLNSLTESVHSGIPMLAIPLFGDQKLNAAIIKHRSLGVYININEITEELIFSSLNQLLNNPQYRANAQKFKEMLIKRPHKPVEEVRKWVEFVAEYPDLSMMNLYGAQLDFITYHNVDLIVVLLALMAFVVYLVTTISKALLKFVFDLIWKEKIE